MSIDVRVFAPVQTIAEVDGISLVLLTVEVLDGLTHLRFYCPRNARTRALDEEHEREIQAYLQRVHRDETTEPPDSPAYTLFVGPLFSSIITLDDGCGTEFSFRGGTTGGTEWLIDVNFLGTPAPQVRQLTVSITPPGRTTSSARIALDG